MEEGKTRKMQLGVDDAAVHPRQASRTTWSAKVWATLKYAEDGSAVVADEESKQRTQGGLQQLCTCDGLGQWNSATTEMTEMS